RFRDGSLGGFQDSYGKTESDRFMPEIRRVLVAVGDPEIEIMAGHVGTAANDAVAGGRPAGGGVHRLDAPAHRLEFVGTPLPGIADHLMQAVSIRWITLHRPGCGLPAETG